MFLFYRTIADALWEYKSLSIILGLLVVYYGASKSKKIKLDQEYIGALWVLGCLVALFLRSLISNINNDTLGIIFKVFTSFALFFVGYRCRNLKLSSIRITYLNMFLIGLQFLVSFVGYGYQTWGEVRTFSGLYFFKTDMALAAVIGLSYILYFYRKNRTYKYIMVLVALFLIFKTNARVHLLTSFLLIAVYYFRNTILNSPKKFFIVYPPILIACFIVVLVVVQTYFSKGLMVVNFDDFGSDSNLQGRNVIWMTLLTYYWNAPLSNQIYGFDLVADERINYWYANMNTVYNSHNTFMFLLISVGALGLLVFLYLSVIFFKRFFSLCKRPFLAPFQKTLLLMFFSNLLIFYISGLSSVTLIHAQQTWFFFFWAGVLFNPFYFQKRNLS